MTLLLKHLGKTLWFFFSFIWAEIECNLLMCDYKWCERRGIRCWTIFITLYQLLELLRGNQIVTQTQSTQFLHTAYTTDNICDFLGTEVGGIDTKYLCVQLSSMRSGSMGGYVATTHILLQQNFLFQTLHAEGDRGRIRWSLIFVSLPSLSFFFLLENTSEISSKNNFNRFSPISQMKPFMGNLRPVEKSSYLEGLRRDSMLFEDFVEPWKEEEHKCFNISICIWISI